MGASGNRPAKSMGLQPGVELTESVFDPEAGLASLRVTVPRSPGIEGLDPGTYAVTFILSGKVPVAVSAVQYLTQRGFHSVSAETGKAVVALIARFYADTGPYSLESYFQPALAQRDPPRGGPPGRPITRLQIPVCHYSLYNANYLLLSEREVIKLSKGSGPVGPADLTAPPSPATATSSSSSPRAGCAAC